MDEAPRVHRDRLNPLLPMSTTRKIEGFVEKRAVTWFDNGESFLTLRRDKYHHGEKIPIADATLIIGGKGYTEAEVKAIEDTVNRIDAARNRLHDILLEVVSVATPHITGPHGERMTYTGPDVAERLATLSDLILDIPNKIKTL